ncbi:MAG: S9 family peptidase [Bryobacterales bacterium]|nr:S9 family peptidase [Bryobacterales bacterium]
MSFRSVSALDISPDGKSAIFETLVPDWKLGKLYADVHHVSMEGGSKTARQMTNTRAADEKKPLWSRDGSFFVFLSNREPASTELQLFMMRPSGSEPWRLTNHKGGVQSFAFSPDGAWLAYSAGLSDERQIYLLKVSEIEQAKPIQLTKHGAPVEAWQFAPRASRIYFTAAVSADAGNRDRIMRGFTAKLRNQETPPLMLWSVEIENRQVRQWTVETKRTVSEISISRDGRWIGFRQTPNDRYQRTVTEDDIYADLYLLSTETGKIERLTENREISESRISFSPDSKMLAFSAPEDFQFFRRQRVYVRSVAGGPVRKLGNAFDGDADIAFWSPDARTIYFNEGVGATQQLFALSVASGDVEQLTRYQGVLNVFRDDDSGKLFATYQDPHSPLNYYAIPSIGDISQRAAWKQLTDSNPQVRDLALGKVETVKWNSTDGREVEGVVVLPVNYVKSQRYPLVVQLHGGPAAATEMNFNATYSNYSQVYAGAGYVCLLPNYRGSTNYGEAFRTQIAGNYFQQGYEDIVSGVDHLVAKGVVDPERMGVMGWSAGGHWSNWILTHTTRFKAISSGAGAMNWISMYAQNDIQRLREHYFGGVPYERFEDYWNVSPLKYIRNAKTPTLIHVVDGDPRVPRPQSEELHMALRKLGVPTEFLVYPGTTHGITDMRNQVLKMVAEFRWMEKWVRGQGEWLNWKELLALIPEDRKQTVASASGGSR